MRVAAYSPASLLKPEHDEELCSLLISADNALELGDRDAAVGCIDEIYRIFDSKVSPVSHPCGSST